LNIAIKQSATHENTLIWAIVCSILLHVLFAVIIPNVKFNPVKIPAQLEVELVGKPEPLPVAIQPESVKPKPDQPKTKVDPKPIVKSLPVAKVEKSEPAPYSTPPVTSPIEPAQIAPLPELLPPPAAIAPTLPKPIGPSQVDMNAARDSYGNTLWGAIGKYKNYPRIAQTRGWQGEVVVELQLDGNGNLKSKKILKSSSFDILDKEALAMVDKAAPFPAPPDALRGSSFSIKVPIPFKLE
jgi:protein TonB